MTPNPPQAAPLSAQEFWQDWISSHPRDVGFEVKFAEAFAAQALRGAQQEIEILTVKLAGAEERGKILLNHYQKQFDQKVAAEERERELREELANAKKNSD